MIGQLKNVVHLPKILLNQKEVAQSYINHILSNNIKRTATQKDLQGQKDLKDNLDSRHKAACKPTIVRVSSGERRCN